MTEEMPHLPASLASKHIFQIQSANVLIPVTGMINMLIISFSTYALKGQAHSVTVM